jgi:hypothetical protein
MEKNPIQILGSKKCCEWLLENPIAGEADVSFVRHAIKTFIVVAKEATLETKQLQVNVSLPTAAAGAGWRGNVPYICLILCLVQDERIRNAFLHCGDAMSRTQLDAHNSVKVRQPTVYKMLAEKWNNPIRYSQALLCTRIISNQPIVHTKR